MDRSGLYRLLLRAFPRDFRRRFGDELEEVFARRCREAEERGMLAVAALWARTVPAVVANGLAERRAGGGGLGGREVLRAGRGLLRAPRYTVAVTGTLALVIATATLYAALADGIVLRPLPYPDSGELVFMGYADGEGEPTVTSAWALNRIEDAATLDGVAYFSTYVRTLTGAGDPVRLNVTHTSDDFFDVVGVPPALGRGFVSGEAEGGTAGVAVLGHALWASRFHSDPDVVGRTIMLDGEPREVVGVMPADFESPDALFRSRTSPGTDLWMPSPADPEALGPGYWTVRGVARLAGAATLERIRSEVTARVATLRDEDPESVPERGFAILPLQQAAVGKAGLRILALLGAAVALALLVGCANVANLAVARALSREGHRAVRVALGAGRRHQALELGAEVMWLGLAGGLAGLALAWVGLEVLVSRAPPLPLLDQVRIDARVVAVAGGVTLVAILLGTLLPSLRIGRGSPGRVLGQVRGTPSRGWNRVQHGFAALQVAAAVALLAGSFLVHGSLRSLLAVDRGFREDGVRLVQVDLPASRYADQEARMRFTGQAVRALEERGEVDRAAFGSSAPQAGVNNFGTRVEVEGWDPSAEEQPMAYFRAVTPGYFDVLGTRLLRGRLLEERDVVDAAPAAALVNREFARLYLEGDGLERRVGVFGQSGLPVVGVVEDVRYGSFAEDPVPELYLPFAGRFTTAFLVVRSDAPGAAVTAAVRQELRALDPSLPLDRIPTMEALVARTVEVERFLRFLVGVLAALVLAIAAVGTYGVLAEAVARRTRELGIRAALGADSGALRRSVLLRGGAVVAAGVAAAVPLAFLAGRAAEGVLFGVRAADPLPYVLSAALVGAVGLLASWIPARRATRADPSRALREE